MTISEILYQKENFTETEKRIADYILAHLNETSRLSVQELAQKAYASHSAVIRLTQKIGYSGFRAFQTSLIEEVSANRYLGQSVDPNFPFNPYDNAEKIAQKMLDLSVHSLQRSAASLHSDSLEEVAKKMLSAKRIFLFATGDSQIRARSFQNKFNKINRYLIIADEYGENDWAALNLTKDDYAIFISYSGESVNYEKFLRLLVQRNIQHLLLTSRKDSSLAKIAQQMIEVPSGEEKNVKVATFTSQIAFEYILNTLYSICYARNYTTHLVDLKDKEETMDSWYN